MIKKYPYCSSLLLHVVDKITAQLQHLGLKAEIIKDPGTYDTTIAQVITLESITIVFEDNEDLNYYKLCYDYQESRVVKFSIKKEKDV